MMPLTLADIGEKNIIKHIGGSPEVKKHLENLGFVVGGEATLITSMAGNVIVNVKETRVAVSREMAQKSWFDFLFRIILNMVEGGRTMETLRNAKVGQTVKVVKLHGEGAVKRRLMDMGLTRGTEVYIRKVAPLGDPVEVTVRNYELSIRKADAEMIEIEAE